jgi:glutamyl-tRNA synthetase
MFKPVLEEHLHNNGMTSSRNDEEIAKVIGLTKDRVNFVPELWEQVNFFFVAPTEYDEKSLKKRWKEDSPKHMEELLAILDSVSKDEWHSHREEQNENGETVIRWHLDDVVMPWIAEKEYGVGIVMNAFRICLVGAARGPHIWNITDVLGKEETLRRVRTALETIH